MLAASAPSGNQGADVLAPFIQAFEHRIEGIEALDDRLRNADFGADRKPGDARKHVGDRHRRTLLVLAALGLVGLTAGFVDAIAGGGGLITVPVLLPVGIPPVAAFGTNKLQSVVGTAIAATTRTRARPRGAARPPLAPLAVRRKRMGGEVTE